MSRNVVVGLVVLGVLSVVLAATVAWNGTKLDQARQERNDLQFEVDDLRQEVDTLTTERDDLQKKVDEHVKAIEQMKAQSGQAKSATDTTPAPAP